MVKILVIVLTSVVLTIAADYLGLYDATTGGRTVWYSILIKIGTRADYRLISLESAQCATFYFDKTIGYAGVALSMLTTNGNTI
jgi:hypothetical protein